MSLDPVPFEFLQQLETSLGTDRQTALTTLGEWLVGYEPLTPRPLEFSSEQVAAEGAPKLRRVA
jgi:hypothetical protein